MLYIIDIAHYFTAHCIIIIIKFYITTKTLMIKVAVNRKLQKFMHGLFILVLYIEVSTVSFAILYCRASLVLLSQQIS